MSWAPWHHGFGFITSSLSAEEPALILISDIGPIKTRIVI